MAELINTYREKIKDLQFQGKAFTLLANHSVLHMVFFASIGLIRNQAISTSKRNCSLISYLLIFLLYLFFILIQMRGHLNPLPKTVCGHKCFEDGFFK